MQKNISNKSSILKETYERPSFKTLQKYVITFKPDNTDIIKWKII